MRAVYTTLVAVIGILVLTAVTVSRNGIWHDEVSLCADMIERSPEKGRGFALLASYYARSGAFALAIANYEEALLKRPSNTRLYTELAKVYRAAGDQEREFGTYQRAVAAGIRDATVHIALGDFHFRAMDMERAAQEYARAVELDEKSPYALYKLGMIDMARGQYVHARDRFQKALALEPGNMIYREYLERTSASLAEQKERP